MNPRTVSLLLLPHFCFPRLLAPPPTRNCCSAYVQLKYNAQDLGAAQRRSYKARTQSSGRSSDTLSRRRRRRRFADEARESKTSFYRTSFVPSFARSIFDSSFFLVFFFPRLFTPGGHETNERASATRSRSMRESGRCVNE